MSRKTARHRKDVPSTTGRIARVGATSVSAVAVTTGSMVAVGAPAEAAPSQVWDSLAQCESSGRWDVNTGNGYFGGLQFSQPTWKAAGGTKLAPRADLASREQQIEIADAWLGRVQAEQGVSRAWATQWPQCSKKLGIRGQRAGGVQTTAAKTVSRNPGEYVVQRGDTLQEIATKQGLGSWKVIFSANRDRIKDPNRIVPGQVLRLSGAVPAAARSLPQSTAPAAAPAPAATTTAVSGSAVVDEARKLVGVNIPYKMGGKSLDSRGLDCSGFVWRVFQRAGLDVPYRASGALRDWASPVSAANAKPGDLVYWPGHIGIYAGNGKVIDQTSSNGGTPRERDIWGSPTYLRVP